MNIFRILIVLGLIQLTGAYAIAQSRMYRLPSCPYFDKWVREHRVQPPDFDALPAEPFIQDPLATTNDGTAHRVTVAEWPDRRKAIAGLVETWLLGHAPPPPGNVRAVLKSTATERGHDVWNVMLEFGPGHRATLHCKLFLPKGRRPAPVFLCNSEYYLRWVEDAMAAGFAVCIYNARDFHDESLAYANLFGDYDWSDFRRRGWSAGRVIDWLETLDFIDKNSICIGGHSRSAKQALAAAAFDERIAAIIPSSPGSGGSLPFRYCDESYFGESLELLTRYFPNWVLPKARYFVGREHKLPCDMHFVYALLAPRKVLMSTGMNDNVESTWTVEQVYKSIHPVYTLLGAPDNFALRFRPGSHSTDDATHRAYSEFLLLATGLKKGNIAERFPFTPYHVWDYAEWSRNHAPVLDVAALPERAISDPTVEPDGRTITRNRWPARREEIRKNIDWLLGEGPAYTPMPVQFGIGESEDTARLLSRRWSNAPKVQCRFGNGIDGNIYYPTGESIDGPRKLPAVIWLTPFKTSAGYSGGYRSYRFALGFSRLGAPHQDSGEYRAGRVVYRNIVDDTPASDGFVIFGFDPVGTGGRQEERRDFYVRHPRWSLMGKMVRDARHAIDVLRQRPDIDRNHIYLVGYAMGGMTAILTAALDDRVAGAVSVAGFTPFRADTDARGTGGVRRYSHLYGRLPRLGAFVGAEAKIPVDFNEIIACIAPRPAIIMAPTGDRHATHADVVTSVEMARNAYRLLGAESRLILRSPNGWNRFTDELQTQVVFFLNSLLP